MPKTNPTLFIIALLSIGALTQFHSSDRKQELKELDQALSKFETSFKTYCEEHGESSVSQFFDHVVVQTKQELQGELEDLQLKLREEQRLISSYENQMKVDRLNKGFRYAQKAKDLRESKMQSAFYKTVLLEQEIELKESELKSLEHYQVI